MLTKNYLLNFWRILHLKNTQEGTFFPIAFNIVQIQTQYLTFSQIAWHICFNISPEALGVWSVVENKEDS